jgi:hypothetical protein
MANTVNSDNLAQVIAQELTIYSRSVTEAIKNEAKSHMKDLVKKTKDTAPVGHRKKHYKNSISSRTVSETDRGAEYQWYVKGSDYRLSHLLERGHATRDGGRVEGTGFISKATEPILADYEKKVEEIIKNGG